MKIVKIGEKYYCKAVQGFTVEQLDVWLSEKLKMRGGSFAEQYSRKIFRDFFRYARDLKQEYLDYYNEEYSTFERFLYQKELWEQDEIESLELKEGETLLELRMTLNNYNAETILQYEENDLIWINQVLGGFFYEVKTGFCDK